MQNVALLNRFDKILRWDSGSSTGMPMAKTGMTQTGVFMSERKSYDPRNHTAEHILNQTMVRMFDRGRSFSAHIEKKK